MILFVSFLMWIKFSAADQWFKWPCMGWTPRRY